MFVNQSPTVHRICFKLIKTSSLSLSYILLSQRYNNFFEATKSNSKRWHERKLYSKAMSTLMNNYFITRVVDLRKKLDEATIYSDSVELFKIRLSKLGY